MPSSLAVLPLLLPLLLLLARPASPASPVKLIIDTDIGGGGCNDVDDVGAICIANALADNGEAEILAIVQNTQPPECTGTISVLNQHYGRASVPIGAYQKQDGVPPGAPGVNPPLRPCRPLPYVPELTNNFPSPIKNTSQVPSSVAVYRSTLAAQPDHSVAISSIGLSTNLAALLRSGPDRHSPLAGPELIAKKVKLLAVMGGKYPTSCPGGKCGCECNFCAVYNDGGQDHVVASAASAFTFANWPREVKILFSGFNVGVQVHSGGALTECAPASNPCRAAYINYCENNPAGCTAAAKGKGRNRFSWDPLTTLVAVRGASAAGNGVHECTDCDGRNVLNATSGDNEWHRGPNANQSYLVLDDGEKAGNALDSLLCQPPKLPRGAA